MKLLKSIFTAAAVVLSCVSCAHKSIDTPQSDSNDVLTIDTCLQSFSDFVLKDRSGCVVAIEPNTGEIKCMSSSKSDCNILSFEFAPDQVYLPVPAMIAFEEGVIDLTANTTDFVKGVIEELCRSKYYCRDRSKDINPNDVAYYAFFFKRTLNNRKYADAQSAYASWFEYVCSLGLGKPLGIDMDNETGGYIPSVNDYTRTFRTSKWKPINVIQDALGKGNIRVTPLQIANLAAIIANRGYFLTPHIMQGEGKEFTKNQSRISPKVYDLMADVMKQETEGGTGYCCFGGTLVNTDDAYTVSMGFFPAENPRIAICCYLDNEGRGGLDAGLLLTMLVDHYEKSIEK